MNKKVVKKEECFSSTCHCKSMNTCGNAVYGLGFIGSAVYYISTATGFWMGVLGVLKAIVWPAFFVYYMFKSLGL